jgi:hypothetical protein
MITSGCCSLLVLKVKLSCHFINTLIGTVRIRPSGGFSIRRNRSKTTSFVFGTMYGFVREYEYDEFPTFSIMLIER